jgi:hypothetical protein
MSIFRLGITLVIFASAACGSFRSDQAVELDTSGDLASSQWNASLSSPSELSGIVQMSGTASLTPSPDGTRTIAMIAVANASPGGLHPWEVRSGECGAAGRPMTFGSQDDYEPLRVGSDGRARATANIDSRIPTSGQYSVVIHASAANLGRVVACGNLAAPTR